ncbi:cell division protein ZapE [Microbacterium karelineae]|uniref:cell division protein ZapE n=1 Tax=Microbacterium karelineae TaxID=2654283 RepID=UPI0018D3CE7D|nr:cell division protein ZapE [Microbacterium karelineae]
MHALLSRIHADAAASGFALDDGQIAAVEAVAGSERGVYIHGPVGRGKSWLADAYFRHAPYASKRRVHFHGFLDELHRAAFARQTAVRERREERTRAEFGAIARPAAGDTAGRRPADPPIPAAPVVITTGPESAADVLTAAPSRPSADPIGAALDDVVGDAELLVFDEFHVHDPGDARLLTRLVEHAIEHGIRIVATSNYAPADLLPDPVWHHIAEPGIRLIESHMHHVHLDGGADYRASAPTATGFAGGSWTTERPMPPSGATTLTVRDREFAVTAAAAHELWITFDELCAQATSTIEYLDWVRRFGRWVILDVPPLDTAPAGAQQRFINAIDVLVDADVPTAISSAVPFEEFAASAAERPDAARLISRLSLLR